MDSFRPMSTSDQLAEHLRREINSGKLSGVMPGIKQLVQSLGVNSVSVTKAVKQLEREGLVINQGKGRNRLISSINPNKVRPLKIGMLYYDSADACRFDSLILKQELANAGHTVVPAHTSLQEMKMDVKRTAKLVQSMDVDAWVIFAGSYQILEWFEQQGPPAFALYGRHNKVNLASMGIRKAPVLSSMISKLITLGHRRIVMLAREERRKPHLGLLEQVFIDELETHGIHTGSFNIPDWDESAEGLERVIDSLFQYTKPTALIIGDAVLFNAVQLHLAHKGIFAPKNISLFCNDTEESFKWTRPDITHIQWDHRPSVRRIIQWAKNISQGVKDRKKSYTKAVLHEGETIGPVARNSLE